MAWSPQLRRWLHHATTGSYVTLDATGRAYIQITTGDDTTTRSTPIDLTAEYDTRDELTALAIPRHGHGYEISYPSGNQ